MVTGHKVDETQTDWNKYISLCKRVVTIPNNKTNLDKSNATTDAKQDVSNKIVVEETKLTSQKPDQAAMNKDEAKTKKKPTPDGNCIEVSHFFRIRILKIGNKNIETSPFLILRAIYI